MVKDAKKIITPVIAATAVLAAILIVLSQNGSAQEANFQTTTTIADDAMATNNTTEDATQTASPGSLLKLSRASVLMEIPLMKAFENGNDLFFILTDSSNNETASRLTAESGLRVNFAPILKSTPDDALNQAYLFTNGVNITGPMGTQPPVIETKPGDENYSPLWKVNMVEWTSDSNAQELKSVDEIIEAQSNGELVIKETNIILNSPAVQWNGGILQVREDKDDINDDSGYMGGQVTDIDLENMVVTFVAHRGWGPDGKTIYYIVTDATPEMPANMMGVPNVPANEKLATTAAAVELFQFTNGINGSGPMGFQAGIGAANPDDLNYTPMWRISFIEWNNPADARVLETMDDINAMADQGLISITPAMEGKHVVNCPFFEPSTVFEHSPDQ